MRLFIDVIGNLTRNHDIRAIHSSKIVKQFEAVPKDWTVFYVSTSQIPMILLVTLYDQIKKLTYSSYKRKNFTRHVHAIITYTLTTPTLHYSILSPLPLISFSQIVPPYCL